MEDCYFCSESSGIAVLHENEHFIVRLDGFPITSGHTLVFTKKHVDSILDLGDEDWRILRETIQNAVEKIKETNLKPKYMELKQKAPNQKSENFINSALNSDFFGKAPDGFNIGLNEGRAAGRTIDHLHIHIIPRYTGDVDDPEGGVRNIFPEKADYK